MHNFKANYDKISKTVKPLVSHLLDKNDNHTISIRKPLISDFQIVIMSITSEYMSIDSENLLFKNLKGGLRLDFPLMDCIWMQML